MAAQRNRSAKNRTAKSRQGAARPSGPQPGARPAKELKPWQLAVFIVLGVIIAAIFVEVGFAKKSNDEYGQYPWARTAVPPKMYYDHAHYAQAGTGSTTGLVRVGKTPGGGIIFAVNTAKKPAPQAIAVQKASGGAVTKYTLVPAAK
jgi:hypothetical protein